MKQMTLSAFGLENLKLTEVADPKKPGPHQVLVKMHAASLNFRDQLVISGQYNPKYPIPLVPCSDGSGEVLEVGESVTQFKVGDPVCATFAPDWIAHKANHAELRNTLGGPLDGTLRELILFEETALVPMPKHLTYEEGATLPCAALTAWSALHVFSRLVSGETVLVQGTGGVSLFALQFAKLAGAYVYSTSSSEEKLERAKKLGADFTLNYKEVPDWGKKIREETKQIGVDHVVEVGGAGTLTQSIIACKPFGNIHLIGILSGKSGEIQLLPAVMNHIKIQGIVVGGRKAFMEMNQAISVSGMKPVVDSIFPMEETKEAVQHLKSASHFGKIVIKIS
ncbi:zinc-binding alcohol dehydrogenase [Leptospira ryugenii]|uniref:Zinc-binding alcohol dehydrogenase n=1 Tax=Leptospira ryugenii TaxID=1917863 RepID=A0A2P2E467_9LEPT|nr:NAD(P)-dependent alcohol dehydrogenase [Leptospira ryugenii]GBF51678.1 zinc-binding alcohol dehydrogenase [Leptospira ryugenii]